MSPTDLGQRGLFSHCPAPGGPIGLPGQMGLALTLLLYWPVISGHVCGSRVGTEHIHTMAHCTSELECKPVYSQLRWPWAPPHSPSREEHMHRVDLWELGGLLVGWQQGGEAGRCEGQSRMALDVISLDFT